MQTYWQQLLTHTTGHYRPFLLYAAMAASVALVVASGLHGARGGAMPQATSAASITVQPGDTLWGLAVRHGPPHTDPRRTIIRIRQLNGIEGSLIQPGQIVLVPR